MARKTKAMRTKKDKVKKATRAAPVNRGGNRKGAGRKSIEVHFTAINARLDILMKAAGLAPVAEPTPAPVVVVAPAPDEAKPKGKPGRKPKVKLPVDPIVTEPTRALPNDPVVTVPPPVFAAPPVFDVTSGTAPVVTPHVQAAALAPPQAFVAPPMQVQAQQFAQQQAQAPVTFSPPPPPQPQFIGVAPTLPQQPAPDFDAQFNALPNRPPQ